MALMFDNSGRKKRHRRIRKRVNGSAERPRISVFRSNRHIYAQVVNDISGHTLAAASSLEKQFQKSGKADASTEVGALLAERALKAGINSAVFDRSGYLYHGRVKLLAQAMREKGLQF